MRFSEFFTAPFIRATAIKGGIFIGLGALIFLGWQYGLLIGALSALLISIALPIIFYVSFLPYKKLKEKLHRPFLFDEPVRFSVKKGTVGGFFVLTEKSMVLLSNECSSPTLELSRDDVKRISIEPNMAINIYLSNTKFIRVFSGAGEELIELLREHGWSIAE